VADLLKHFEDSIRVRELLRRGQSVLIAVSGGLDSVVLLHLLRALAPKYRWRLTVGHFNHQLRGRSSDADEKLVRETAKRLGLRCVVDRRPVKRLAQERKESIEMAARSLRHEFLARSARKLKCKVVVFAHHADDQVELFFLRLFRGAGGVGLGGMKWSSCSPADESIQLVRPLLDVSKIELAEWAEAHNVSFREDASNATADFLRNRIRHKLLPLLRRDFQPALDEVIPRVMKIITAEAEFAIKAAEAWRQESVQSSAFKRSGPRQRGTPNKRSGLPTPFDELPVAVQRRVLQLQFFSNAVTPPDFELIERLRSEADKQVTIAPDVTATRDAAGRLRIEKARNLAFSAQKRAINLNGRAGEFAFDGAMIRWKVEPVAGVRVSAQVPHYEEFDSEKIGTTIVVRHWRPGDRFQPIGMSQPVKLQNWFTNLKIPAAKRRELLVAETEGGELFWVEDQRISERVKLTRDTRRRLVWHWHRP
jgi:tRNA(Ile)-lysidine synthase